MSTPTAAIPQRPPLSAARPSLARQVPVVSGVLAVLLRLTWAGHPLGADESGFLTVAHQWSPGTSLYGDYWVDRPPLLIAIYQVADVFGGTIGLRVVGALAVLVTVVAIGSITRRITGSTRASGWSAVCAAALLASPIAGAYDVNGELLAAPFIALGVLGAVVALAGAEQRRPWVGGALAGAGAVAALLVKQNMADVLVAVAVLAVVGLAQRRLSPRELITVSAGAVTAGVAVAATVLGWAALHGTSPGGVLWAMYPFRMEAGKALAASPGTAAHQRGLDLVRMAVISGLLPALGAIAAIAVRRGRAGLAVSALPLVWAGWAIVSIALGGNYWGHYLVQLILPVSVGLGTVLAGRERLMRWLVALCTVPALISTFTTATSHHRPHDEIIGRAIGQSSRPGDSIVVAWGRPDVVHAAGLPSPYPSLWSLPTKTLDPRLTGLADTLDGPHAPTWFVVRKDLRTWGLQTESVATRLRHDYRPVAHLCGATVYLHDGLDRPTPAATCG